MSDTARQLYAAEIERHVLALREALVRHDENWKAHVLLDECVPYFAQDLPGIATARQDQRAMVFHLIDPDAYTEYYATNPHERPFEEQYGIRPEEAHKHLHRVGFLCRGLRNQGDPTELRVCDLAMNDGWMLANLAAASVGAEGTLDGVDLNPGCVARAKMRLNGHGTIKEGDIHDAPELLFGHSPYDAVVAFEVIEHVRDPHATLGAMSELVADNGRLYVSTPHEAVDGGNLPDWDRVERKGHVRVFTAESFRELLEAFGSIDRFEIGPDRVMVAELRPGGSKPRLQPDRPPR